MPLTLIPGLSLTAFPDSRRWFKLVQGTYAVALVLGGTVICQWNPPSFLLHSLRISPEGTMVHTGEGNFLHRLRLHYDVLEPGLQRVRLDTAE